MALRRRLAGRPQPPPGFTLIEVMMALALLSASMLLTADVIVLAARAAQVSRATTIATTLAAQKIEQLRALGWGIALDGSTAADFTADVASWPLQPTGGPGLTPSPPASLTSNVPGYVDYLDATSRWVGAGSSPPASAAFIRRWSVEPAGGGAPTTFVLHVAVWRRAPPGPSGTPGTPVWVPTIQLDGAKARRGE